MSQRYLTNTSGKKHSTKRIRQILRRLGYSFIRPTKRPTEANKEAQEPFKRGDGSIVHKENVSLYALDKTAIKRGAKPS